MGSFVGSFVLTKTNVYLEHRAAHALSHFVYVHLQLPTLCGILIVLYGNMTILLYFHTRNTLFCYYESDGLIYINIACNRKTKCYKIS